MSSIRQRKRIVMQPLGNMNNVARRPSVANRGKHNLDTQGMGDDSLSADNDLDEFNWSGSEKHVAELISNNPDISDAEADAAISYVTSQDANWQDLDVWD